MSATQDFVALEWIKGEIEQTLDQAQQALEAVAESAEDSSSMRACLTSLHQVHGTLRMVELEGPAQLSLEMEELAQALMSNEVPDVGRAQEVLMQAILQMPAYLDRIQREQKDAPGTVRPIINNLRVARGEARIGGGDTPAPVASGEIAALTTPPVAEVIAAFNAGDGAANAKKLRARYQQALVALLKRESPRENLSLMGKVFTMLVRLCGESPKGNLFQLSIAVVEGIAGGAIKFDSAMAGNLRALDAELKALAEEGDVALSKPPSTDLGTALYEAVAGASRETPRIVAARKKFAPAMAVVEEEEDEAVSFGPDDETLAAVSRILIEELTSVTDKLDLYVRSANPAVKDLVDLVPQL
ncbi:MAG TPA: Hpt domain-containing protein, partial [Pseudomonadales bacterium]|nr:Hpt domain-containing protein [Pseudomonadales bacterium]